LTKSEWDAKEAALEVDAGKGEADGDKEGAEPREGKETKESKEKLAAIGSSKKRKAGKVVGADEEDVAPEFKKPVSKPEGKKVEKGKSAKKGKKIKLSFEDDE
jgi:hypothetical protein